MILRKRMLLWMMIVLFSINIVSFMGCKKGESSDTRTKTNPISGEEMGLDAWDTWFDEFYEGVVERENEGKVELLALTASTINTVIATDVLITLNYEVDGTSDSVIISRNTSESGTYENIGELPASASSFEDIVGEVNGPLPNIDYWYKVTATRNTPVFGLETRESVPFHARIDPPPGPPASLSASVSGTDIVITWSAPAETVDYYILDRSVNGEEYSELVSSVGTTSYTDTTISADVAYEYRVKAHNSNGDSTYSNSDSAMYSLTNSVTKPTNVAATDKGQCGSCDKAGYDRSETTVRITWDYAANGGEDAPAYYKVYRYNSHNGTTADGDVKDITAELDCGAHTCIAGKITATGSSFTVFDIEQIGAPEGERGTSRTLSGPYSDHIYYYSVRGFSDADKPSLESDKDSGSAEVSTLEFLRIVSTNWESNFNKTMQAISSGENYIDGNISTKGGSDENGDGGTDYTWTPALDYGGTGQYLYKSVDFINGNIGTAFIDATLSTAVVTWRYDLYHDYFNDFNHLNPNHSTGETAIKNTGGHTSNVTSTGKNGVDTGLVHCEGALVGDVEFHIKVVANYPVPNEHYDSGDSNSKLSGYTITFNGKTSAPINITKSQLVSPPIDVTATNQIDDKITLKWRKSANAFKYWILRADSEGGEYQKIGEIDDKWTYSAYKWANDSYFLSYIDSDIEQNAQYWYKIEAIHYYSASASGVRSAKRWTFTWDQHESEWESDPVSGEAQDSNTLAKPLNVQASDGDGPAGEIVITWNQVSHLGEPADKYEVFRSDTVGGPYTSIASDITELQYNDDSGVTLMQDYFYQVKAFKTPAALESGLSASDVGYASAAALNTVTNVQASDGTVLHEVGISWDFVSGATGYKVYRADISGGPETEICADSNCSTSPYTDSISTPGQYFYTVKAYSADSQSGDFSNEDAGHPGITDAEFLQLVLDAERPLWASIKGTQASKDIDGDVGGTCTLGSEFVGSGLATDYVYKRFFCEDFTDDGLVVLNTRYPYVTDAEGVPDPDMDIDLACNDNGDGIDRGSFPKEYHKRPWQYVHYTETTKRSIFGSTYNDNGWGYGYGTLCLSNGVYNGWIENHTALWGAGAPELYKGDCRDGDDNWLQVIYDTDDGPEDADCRERLVEDGGDWLGTYYNIKQTGKSMSTISWETTSGW